MPGPICTWERDYDVNDGTSCKMPSQTPGPMVRRSPNIWERGEAVFEAYEKAQTLAPAAVTKKTGYELGQLLKGLWPGLLQTLIILAASTTLGAVAGGVIGFFFAGVGAAPGAVIGGEIGLDIGTAVLSWLGLAFLAAAIIQGFGELWATLSAGVKRAWAAPESPEKEYPHEIDAAANELADAVGILVLLILQGIVAWVFGKAGIRATRGALAAGRAVSTAGSDVAAADAVAALVKQLRASKLGSGFADWVEQNWPRLRDDPKLRFQPRAPVGGSPGMPEQPGAKISTPGDRTPIAGNEPAPTFVDGEIPPSQRQKVAAGWYGQQPRMTPGKAAERAAGLDPTKPMEIKTLTPGTKIAQWVRNDGKPGIDFTTPDADPSTLGLEMDPATGLPKGRSLQIFEVAKPTQVLQGVAAPFPEGVVPLVGGQGGGPQIAMPPGWQDSIVRIPK